MVVFYGSVRICTICCAGTTLSRVKGAWWAKQELKIQADLFLKMHALWWPSPCLCLKTALRATPYVHRSLKGKREWQISRELHQEWLHSHSQCGSQKGRGGPRQGKARIVSNPRSLLQMILPWFLTIFFMPPFWSCFNELLYVPVR